MTAINTNGNDFPGVYTPADIQKILGRGRRQTYDLLKEGRFPVKQVGKSYVIPKEPFNNWLNSPGFYNVLTSFT